MCTDVIVAVTQPSIVHAMFLQLQCFNKLLSLFALFRCMYTVTSKNKFKEVHKQAMFGVIVNGAHMINAQDSYDGLLDRRTHEQGVVISNNRDASIFNVADGRSFRLCDCFLLLLFHVSRSLKQTKCGLFNVKQNNCEQTNDFEKGMGNWQQAGCCGCLIGMVHTSSHQMFSRKDLQKSKSSFNLLSCNK